MISSLAKHPGSIRLSGSSSFTRSTSHGLGRTADASDRATALTLLISRNRIRGGF